MLTPCSRANGYTVDMTNVQPTDRAELVESIHQPWKATVGECLHRWHALDPAIRERSYMVLRDDSDRRTTLNAHHIATLAAGAGWA